jgi:predicted dehydrogenase
MSVLNVGIIGFGRIGVEHSRWLAAAEGIRASAIDDVTPARRALAEHRDLQIYSTIDQLLADPKVDAVLVSTPTAMHFDHAMRALAAGKHVMVEKPMTLDLKTSRQLLDEAQRRNRVLSVFHNRRWDADYLTLKQAVQSGQFGRIINVESRLGQWESCVGPAAKEYHPTWRNEAAYGGGGLYDWGSHFVDQIWRLLLPAKPQRVFAQLRGNVWTRDCDDFARVIIDFDNGAAAMVEINTTTTRPLPRWHVDGLAGSADSPFSLKFDLDTWARLEFTPAPDGPPRAIARAAPGLSETEIWSQFARAIGTGSPPAVKPESVLPTMALLDAARQSARTGRTIEITDGSLAWID